MASVTTYVNNKKAHFNYDVLRAFEAGIELFGHEVKALKAHHGSLDGAYVVVRGGEAYLVGATIPPFQANNTPKGYDKERNRRLLLKKSEIKELSETESGKGLTIVALAMYNNKGKIKVEIGIARGKKKFDKRETMKRRESDREIQRTLKNK